MKKFIVLFILTPLLAFPKFGRNAEHVSFYWGKTYRLGNNYYNTFDISWEHYRSSCINAYYRGFGFRFDDFNNNNYSIGMKFFRSLLRRPSLLLIPYYGISPVIFKMGTQNGLNLKPEIGVRYNTSAYTRRQPLSLSINVSYGYDIPIVNEALFTINRHDFNARIGLSVNINDIRYYFNARKEKKRGTLPAEGQENPQTN
ncbi:MAG: hypothetical protein H0W61_04065 [Bacteroidetes bacterium]|nr:hypothetical protein [Bacteroidota bacterium]